METKLEDYKWSHQHQDSVIHGPPEHAWIHYTLLLPKKNNHGPATEPAPPALPPWFCKDTLQSPTQKFLNLDDQELGNPGQIYKPTWM